MKQLLVLQSDTWHGMGTPTVYNVCQFGGSTHRLESALTDSDARNSFLEDRLIGLDYPAVGTTRLGQGYVSCESLISL